MEKKALLVIDVQQGLFEKTIPIYQAGETLENINILMNRARKTDVPVVFIQHSNKSSLAMGSDTWQLRPEIQPLDDETIIHKLQGNAFEGTNLREKLTQRDIDTLLITGLATQWCVRATTLGALKLGYRVIVASDGHSNFSKDAKNLIKKWNRTFSEKGVEVIRTREIEFERSIVLISYLTK